MRNYFPILLGILLFAACNTEPEPKGETLTFTETDEIIANPERGVFAQIYYTSDDLTLHADPTTINNVRNSLNKVTIYLHSYYLTDYMECDIPQEFLDRIQTNMDALRQGGAKAVLRFSYKSDFAPASKPWDASPEWVHKHIDQITPYLQKNADVIMCVQCGFIGSWGEWYYTSHFPIAKQDDYEKRWQVLEHMLRAVPKDRQVALRTPQYKMKYLQMRGQEAKPLTPAEAYDSTNYKARICGHNDCFVSSANDKGTFVNASSQDDRLFWQEDTKYTFMGGETCECSNCSYGNSANALKNMEMYHWSYINRDYYNGILAQWRVDGTMNTVLRRLGYRLALDKVILTPEPKTDKEFKAYFVLHNSGFAAPMNKRDVELILVNANDPSKKFVYPQSEDPRFWLPGEHRFTLACKLNGVTPGKYKLYLNLPDPYKSLHNDPRYSIRLANENVWEESTGYNYISTITVE